MGSPFEGCLYNCSALRGPAEVLADVHTKVFEGGNPFHLNPHPTGVWSRPLHFLKSKTIPLVLLLFSERLLSWHHFSRAPTSSL